MFLNRFLAGSTQPEACRQCRDSEELAFEIRMAFQPILDVDDKSVFAYEALVRSADGGPASDVLEMVRPEQRYRFDQTCRVKAIVTAAQLGLQQRLSINFLPNAVYEPATCIRLTLEAARQHGFPTDKLIFETAESERVTDLEHLTRIFRDYANRGFMTAIDDFGSGFAGLTMLANFQPDLLKLDISLVRGVDADPAKLAIVEGVVHMAAGVGSRIVAEGVETVEEFKALHRLGVRLYQGYLFARPEIEKLPVVDPAIWSTLGL